MQLLSEGDRAAKIGELRADLREDEIKSVDSRRDDAVKVAGNGTSCELVKQTSGRCAVDGSLHEGTVLDERTEREGVERAGSSVTTEEDGVFEVHGQDLSGDVIVGVRVYAIVPVVGNALACFMLSVL